MFGAEYHFDLERCSFRWNYPRQRGRRKIMSQRMASFHPRNKQIGKFRGTICKSALYAGKNLNILLCQLSNEVMTYGSLQPASTTYEI
jgi:hypothetical protein